MIPGARAIDEPQVLRQDEGRVQFHAATLAVELHRTETEGYKRNLANQAPVVYVLLRSDEDDGENDAPRPHLVTVCPYEAQDYLDADGWDESLESVPMPDALKAWVQSYIDAHHVDEPFYKRKRKKWKTEDPRRQPSPGGSGPNGGDSRGHG